MGLQGRAGPDADVTAETVLRVGRRQFLRGERIDLVAIAAELEISRATIYRWIGRQDEVVGEVLASLATDTLDVALARQRGEGAALIADAIIDQLAMISDHPSMKGFLASDPKRALTILTGPDSRVAAALVQRYRELIVRHCPGAADDGLSADDLAYALLKLGEAFCYADITTGRPIGIAQTRPLIRRLLEVRAR